MASVFFFTQFFCITTVLDSTFVNLRPSVLYCAVLCSFASANVLTFLFVSRFEISVIKHFANAINIYLGISYTVFLYFIVFRWLSTSTFLKPIN